MNADVNGVGVVLMRVKRMVPASPFTWLNASFRYALGVEELARTFYPGLFRPFGLSAMWEQNESCCCDNCFIRSEQNTPMHEKKQCTAIR
jgi:hypothetical protein